MKAKVLVLPVLRRYWLFHAWKETSANEQVAKNWRDAPNMKDKASLLLSNLQARVSGCTCSCMPVCLLCNRAPGNELVEPSRTVSAVNLRSVSGHATAAQVAAHVSASSQHVLLCL
eukprot:GHUV01055763.1.p1 GENE.GHUV01055763.1~~GHUV01055763.1.p1  ORF type:complete len:116 (-),score=23.37 GHUV01055763.1:227-574(-)